ncbi:hypothetical protein K7G82_23610 [Sphingomonas colocasiae]|uniref:Uncharacterized protein n=1 Tax=Sphingomonas colocasiae TaxID=1848973 RepID=A0ABS7PVC6_9SPHN|nr:hypothetical protein [Sphingomonas colocasiae]
MAAPAGASLTILYNGKLARTYKVVRPRAFAIAGRALDTLINEADRERIRSYRRFAEDHAIAFDMVTVDEDYPLSDGRLFDPAQMRALFEQGLRQAERRPADGPSPGRRDQ